MKQPKPRPEPRHDTMKAHLIAEQRHDPYKSRGKIAEPSACPQCSAVFLDGRWQWAGEPVAGATPHVCPACHRINDKYPAGEIRLSGAFVAQHAAEIERLMRNVEAAEKREHPMQRIMGLERRDDGLVVTTTDIHLPRRIGHALESAYKGALETHYDEGGYFVRIRWTRES